MKVIAGDVQSISVTLLTEVLEPLRGRRPAQATCDSHPHVHLVAIYGLMDSTGKDENEAEPSSQNNRRQEKFTPEQLVR